MWQESKSNGRFLIAFIFKPKVLQKEPTFRKINFLMEQKSDEIRVS